MLHGNHHLTFIFALTFNLRTKLIPIIRSEREKRNRHYRISIQPYLLRDIAVTNEIWSTQAATDVGPAWLRNAKEAKTNLILFKVTASHRLSLWTLRHVFFSWSNHMFADESRTEIISLLHSICQSRFRCRRCYRNMNGFTLKWKNQYHHSVWHKTGRNIKVIYPMDRVFIKLSINLSIMHCIEFILF